MTNHRHPGDDVDELSASDESEPEEQPSRAPFDPELDHSGDDGEVLAPAAAPTAQSSFILSGASSAFSHRSRSIFHSLDSLERQPEPLNQPLSICPTPPKKRGVPDYLVHPERWTRYSLEDVPESSDQTNRMAAHHFLSSLQPERKQDSPCNVQQKMVFSRPKRPLKDQIPADQQGKEKGLHLSHLAEEEEEEEEEVGRKRKEAGGRTGKILETTDGGGKAVEKAVGSAEEKTMEDCSPGFNSFRKLKGKVYRKSSGHEDN